MKRLGIFAGIITLMLLLAGCTDEAPAKNGDDSMTNSINIQSKAEENVSSSAEKSKAPDNTSSAAAVTNKADDASAPELFYFGHASMCIVTEDGSVIYIDPYANGDYSRAADLILVTHGHFDHTQVDKVENRNDGCEIITHEEALQNGEYGTFEFPFVTVEAVEAGNNPNHDIASCVGYVLTFKNGRTLYVSGDTSTTDQMSELADRQIDYAFFCCDGVYNMDNAEAARCAETVGAKHNIPYHNSTSHTGEMFDRELAESWNAPNKLIIYPGESIAVE